MKIIAKDILTVKKGIIVHQVNCAKKMGAGLAKQISTKYPQVFTSYFNVKWMLGKVQLVKINDDLYVCNLAAQESYGKSKYRYTDYDAMRIGFQNLKKTIEDFNIDLPIFVPFKIGCGLGNGNWNTVYNILKEEIPEATICKWEKII